MKYLIVGVDDGQRKVAVDVDVRQAEVEVRPNRLVRIDSIQQVPCQKIQTIKQSVNFTSPKSIGSPLYHILVRVLPEQGYASKSTSGTGVRSSFWSFFVTPLPPHKYRKQERA